MSTPAQPAPANTDQITEARKRSLANLRPPFEKGRSGNYSGRPKRSLAEITVQRMLKARVPEDSQNRRAIELIVRGLIARAVRGDADCARLLFERGYGKVALEPEFEPIVAINLRINQNIPKTICGETKPPTIEGE